MERSGTILIADDDQNDVTLISYALNEAGLSHPVHWLKTGEQLVEYLSENQSPRQMPLLVIIDWNMPRSDPVAILKWIRTQPDYTSLSILVLTGSKNPGEMQQAYQAGANWHLVKSGCFENVIELVKRI